MELNTKPARIQVNGLDILFHPGFYTSDVCKKIMSELENIAYNSDEASQVMMFGEKVNIPRKQVAFSDPGISYRFAGADVPGKPWPEFLSIIRDEMNNYLRVQGILPKDSEDKLNYVLVNLYRDGSDYIGPHRDNEPDMYDITTIQDGAAKKETVIVSLSFGASRDFIFQRQDNPAIRYPMILQSGDLLVMRGDTNKYWKHSVPKRLRVKTSRYNLTFRFMRSKN